MSSHYDVAQALERARGTLAKRPGRGPQEDAAATARWKGGLRVTTSHANGAKVDTDLPPELGGGGGEHVTPAWLFRAGLASCTATTIAMAAASAGIELALLEIRVDSRSDTRGLLGMTDANGEPVDPGPEALRMEIGIRAHGVAPERLRCLAEQGLARSPLQRVLQLEMPMTVRVLIGDEATS